MDSFCICLVVTYPFGLQLLSGRSESSEIDEAQSEIDIGRSASGKWYFVMLIALVRVTC